ncbi:type VII secretion-associated serine protease mycosin [Streptomyces niger]|uniref:type VII secretion-associated serine protease mycosin n=1 Tax=Streptomyces niger TaxID=66373 RepID=UPI00069BA1A0
MTSRKPPAGFAPTAVLAVLVTLMVVPSAGAAERREPATELLEGSGQCTFPMKKQIKGTPWALQRIVLDQLWKDTKGLDPEGRPVRVAVIDTGVDDSNVQLKAAVDARAGGVYLPGGKDADATEDQVGHGTKVAGIIAARPRPGTGFVGLAPQAKIIPLKQNDDRNSGRPEGMAQAIKKAMQEGAKVINISQDTVAKRPSAALTAAVEQALNHDIVVVAAAGNDGADGKSRKTYPAAIPGVLAVGASDRDNGRASFSQSGDFVGVAAPGVDIVSTVPKGGQCVDNGTSFSAPYVSGVAALIRAKHPDWKAHQVVAQIEQTAERGVNGRDKFIGWGVVDPVRALSDDDEPIEQPSAEADQGRSALAPDPFPVADGETPAERKERIATYTLGAAGVLVAIAVGTAAVLRERARRRSSR